MRPFEYLEPETLEEALHLLDRFGGEGKVLAGGTDLIIQLKQKSIQPRYVINIKKIDRLKEVEFSDQKELRIGSLATLSSICHSKAISGGFKMVAEASRAIGTFQVRNIATIGGNICNASPSADLSPALIALRAHLKIESIKGKRVIPIEKFFVGPYKTCLASSELLTEIHLATPPVRSAGTYAWLPKYASVDETLVGCGIWMRLDLASIQIEDVVIGLGAVSPIPMRAIRAETFLKGEKIEEYVLERAGEIASQEAKPIGRFGISAEYRKELVKVLVVRNLKKVIEEILKRDKS
jgi:carbon-monoxide dehydrogenase medium subunit